MSDIRFNQWLHQSGTGGVSQVASGAVGVGTTNPLADFYVRGDAQITGILTAGHIAMGSSITFGDNDRIYLGDGTDFQLYHNSADNNSYIVESGAGSLVVNASALHVKNAANNEDIAKFTQSGNNELYFSNSKKFETTNTGAVVTGILTATTFKGGAEITSGSFTGATGTFSGDVSIADKIIHTGDTNTAIRFPANDTFAVELGGDERLRITTTGTAQIKGASGEAEIDFMRTNAAGSNGNTFGKIAWLDNNSNDVASLRAVRQSAVDDASVVISTRPTGGSITERLRITSAGNVGINRSNPDQRLNVSGNIEVNAHDNNSGNGGYKTSGGLIIGNAFDAGKTSSDDRNAIIWQERGLDLDFATSDTFRMKIRHDGSVGIGITNPAKTGIQNNVKVLQIDGGDGAELILGNSVSPNVATNHIGAIAFKNIDTTSGTAPHYAGIRCNCTSTSGHMNLKFYAGKTEFEADTPHMSIDSSGRVLIGATAKRNILNQNNNSGGDSTTPLLYVEGTGDSKSLTIVSNNTNAWRGSVLGLARTRGTSVGSSTVIQDDDNIGQIVFAAADGTDIESNVALIKADVDGTPGANDTPGRLVFSTTADGAVTATERLRIDSSGRHGINVTNTGDYYSAADDLIIREKDGGDSGLTIRTGTGSSGLICFADGASSSSDQYRRGQIRYHHNSDSMDFTTAGNTARVVISSTGQVHSKLANTTDYNADNWAQTGSGSQGGANQAHPDPAIVWENRGKSSNVQRFGSYIQSTSGGEKELYITIRNSSFYRITVKTSHNSTDSDVAMWLVYGHNSAAGGGTNNRIVNVVNTSSGGFTCTQQNTHVNSHDSTIKIAFSGNSNQGLRALVEVIGGF